jgi:hypothetical protein
MIVRAHFRPHFRGPLTATPRPPLTPFLASFSRFSKSHRIISFADPHPLTPLESYRFKNRGGGRVSPTPSHPVLGVTRARRGGRDLLFLCLFLLCVPLRSQRLCVIFSCSRLSLPRCFYPSVLQSLERLIQCPQNNTLSISANTRTPAATAAIC